GRGPPGVGATLYAEEGGDAVDDAADGRRGDEAAGPGIAGRLVDQDQDRIALGVERAVGREYSGEGADRAGRVIAPVDQLVGRPGLAAHAQARRVGTSAGTTHDVAPQQVDQGRRGLGRHHLPDRRLGPTALAQ